MSDRYCTCECHDYDPDKGEECRIIHCMPCCDQCYAPKKDLKPLPEIKPLKFKDKILFPKVKAAFPSLSARDIASAQPMMTIGDEEDERKET